MISGCKELILVILDKTNGNLRVGQRKLFNKVSHMGSLCHGCL